MKVLFVFNHPAPYKVQLFNELSKHIDLTVIFERNKNKDREKDFYSKNKYNFKSIFIKGIKLGNENMISNGVTKHLKKNSYDLIIMNGYSNIPELKAIKYLKKHNKEYALYINGGIINHKESKWKKNLKTKYISGAKFYFSPDERSDEYLVYYGADKSKIYNYPYATIYDHEVLDKKPSKEERENLLKELNVTGENIFVSCGQLIERKNYLKLVELWKDQPVSNTLLIIGSGKQKPQIEAYISENKITNVKLLGYLNRDEIFKYYRISDAFIFPSKEDIYGHVVNEALSQGLPVISGNNVNSALHLEKNEAKELILEDIDSKSLNNAINYVLSHDLFNESTAIARENTYEKMVRNHLDIIKEATK